jgi:hypothetical protein
MSYDPVIQADSKSRFRGRRLWRRALTRGKSGTPATLVVRPWHILEADQAMNIAAVNAREALIEWSMNNPSPP